MCVVEYDEILIVVREYSVEKLPELYISTENCIYAAFEQEETTFPRIQQLCVWCPISRATLIQ